MTETIGVAGVGSIGAQHAVAFASLGMTVIVWDPVADAGLVRERIGAEVTVVPTFDDLVERAALGLVVASPDEHHGPQLAAANRAGLAVLVEKPVAPASADVTALLRELAQPERVLVGYVLRHHASLRRAAELVATGTIGTVLSFHATVGAYDTLRLARQRFADGRPDTLYVDYSHEWDVIRWLVGEMRSVAAVASTRGDLPILRRPNLVDAVFRGDEATGTAHLDYVQDPGLRELTLIGDRGALTVSATARTLRLRLRDDETERVETFPSTRAAGLRLQAEHFVDVARGITTPAVTLADGRAALRIAEAVRSATATEIWTEIENEEHERP